MARYPEVAAPSSPPPPVEPPTPIPDEGMVFSTVTIVRTQNADLAIEHPAGWTPKQVQAAVAKRTSDLCRDADWWEADTATVPTQIQFQKFDPDNDHRMPFALGPDDLLATPPIAIVK